MKPSTRLVLALIMCMDPETLRAMGEEHARAKFCPCLPEVRNRQPAANGCCWNCGKPIEAVP